MLKFYTIQNTNDISTCTPCKKISGHFEFYLNMNALNQLCMYVSSWSNYLSQIYNLIIVNKYIGYIYLDVQFTV